MRDPALADGLVDLVRRVARDEIMPRFRRLDPDEIDTKSGPNDLVTVTDRRAESAIARGVRSLLPQAVVVGEEACAGDPDLVEAIGTAETCVIVDPIDGTANYAAGLATFGVILAVVRDGRTIFGLLYDPVMDDWILAHAGGGAWFCRDGSAPRRLSGRDARALEAAHGYLALHLFPPARRGAVAACMPAFEVVRTLRCSCHEYRMMALGQADFMISPLVKPWDHAAGALVVTEAGGDVRVGGAPYAPVMRTGPIVAVAAPGFRDPLMTRTGSAIGAA